MSRTSKTAHASFTLTLEGVNGASLLGDNSEAVKRQEESLYSQLPNRTSFLLVACGLRLFLFLRMQGVSNLSWQAIVRLFVSLVKTDSSVLLAEPSQRSSARDIPHSTDCLSAKLTYINMLEFKNNYMGPLHICHTIHGCFGPNHPVTPDQRHVIYCS